MKFLKYQIAVLAAAMAFFADALPAYAQTAPDYGLQWVAIGDPGNRGAVLSEVPSRPQLASQNLGAVSYEYRMTQTEITTSQWFEFVQAYAPYYDGVGSSVAFTGLNITNFGSSYFITSGVNAPTIMSWEYAARYCNWLHNDKALTREAFESGAYDVSTFTLNPDGSTNHQLTRSPGAKFWIPSRDEWIKATYWDPDKNDGAGGYWRHPGGSDVPLISGPPGSGAQTNAGANGSLTVVGAYPEVSAPWGLLDTSGGLKEWTEQLSNPDLRFVRQIRGSDAGNSGYATLDAIDGFAGVGGTSGPFAGLRLASIIPAPHSAAVLGLLLVPIASRRRTCSHGGVV